MTTLFQQTISDYYKDSKDSKNLDLEQIRMFEENNPIPDDSFLITMATSLYRRINVHQLLTFLDYCRRKDLLKEQSRAVPNMYRWINDFQSEGQPNVVPSEKVVNDNKRFMEQPINFSLRFDQLENKIDNTELSLTGYLEQTSSNSASILEQFQELPNNQNNAFDSQREQIDKMNDKLQQLYDLFVQVDNGGEEEPCADDKNIGLILEKLNEINDRLDDKPKKAKKEKDPVASDTFNMLDILWTHNKILFFSILFGTCVFLYYFFKFFFTMTGGIQ